MRVVVTIEQRLLRTPDGHIWTSAQFPYGFWQRYLDVFDAVRIVARVRDVGTVGAEARRVDGDGATVVAVPHYIGAWQCFRQGIGVLSAVSRAVERNDAVILRISSALATCLHWHLRRQKRPYGVEVVCDPHDVFAPGVVTHPLRPLLRSYFTRAQAKQCADACGAAYVTERFLQARYPCRRLEVAVSDVEIRAADRDPFPASPSRRWSGVDPAVGELSSPLPERGRSTPFGLVTVASLDRLYKGTDALIGAVARTVRAHHDVALVVIGDGAYRDSLAHQAVTLGVGDRVSFTGMLPPDAVRRHLEQADLFVLPSRTEGLPRAMIEAMASGCACIGSTAGGIPELLEPQDMVAAGDEDGLARAIVGMLTDPDRRAKAAARNHEKAKEFDEDVLGERRRGFYRHVRRVTDEWLRGTAMSPARTTPADV